MQDNTLLTVRTKKLSLTHSFLMSMVDTNFSLKKSGRDVSHGVYQKTSIKTELFILLTLDLFFFYTNARLYFTHGVFRKTSIKN